MSVMSFEEVDRFDERVWILFFYGSLLGGCIPVLVLITPDINLWQIGANLVPDRFEWLTWTGISIMMVGIALMVVARHYHRSYPKLCTGSLYLSAILILISLSIFVYVTGGPVLSQFAFSYLYIPVIVAIVFTRLRPVIFVSIASFVCFSLLLFSGKESKEMGIDLFTKDGAYYELSHLVSFAWQLGWAIVIERQVERLNDHKQQNGVSGGSAYKPTIFD